MKIELLCDHEMSDKTSSSSKKSPGFLYISLFFLVLGPGGVTRPSIRQKINRELKRFVHLYSRIVFHCHKNREP